MSRDLSSEPLADLLLNLEANKRDAEFVVQGHFGVAHLRLARGRLVDADCAGVRGLPALELILALVEGKFELHEGVPPRESSFDVSVAEALLGQVLREGTSRGSFSSEPLAPKSSTVEEVSARHAQTTPGLFAPSARRIVLEPKTLLGFPASRIGDNEHKKSDPPAPIPLVRRSAPPARFAGRHSSKPSGTGYSSAPPPSLAEERIELPKSLGSAPQAMASDSAPPAVGKRLAHPIEEEAAETGPIPSIQLDRQSLDRLEALHEGISSTTHAIPARPMMAIEDWPKPATVEPPLSDTPSLPRVGRYEVLARLKTGGMGSIYLCRLSGSAGFRRLFAMKVLHQDFVTQEETLGLFFREANLLAQLHHPNIVGIVDVGSVQQPYLVLDYIEGGSFHEVLRASPSNRPAGAIVTIVLDALNGLSAAHSLRDDDGQPIALVHNDISPHNLLVGIDGTCRVTDFGVAGARGAPAETLAMRGKPSFIAPERLQQRPSDGRSDLFSLGVVLYSALTGVHPFLGADAQETLVNVLERPIQPPSEVGLRPPPCLDWVCMKALSRNPAERFQSADEMATQLRRIAAREDLLAAPSVVAAWVRDVLAPTLQTRRAAALKGTGASMLPPGDFQSVTPPSAALDEMASDPPPSSGDFSDRTEVLSSAPMPAAAVEHSVRNYVVYAAILLSAVAVGSALLFPEQTGRLLKHETTPSRPTAEEAHEAEKQAVPEHPEDETPESGSADPDLAAPVVDPDIHLPAIKPRGAGR